MTEDRNRAAWEAILNALIPNLLAFAVWEYRVLSTQAGPPVLVTAQSVDTGGVGDASRVPNLVDIVVRPGPDGGYAQPGTGSSVLVGFANGNFNAPYIHSLDPATPPSNSWQLAASIVELGGTSSETLARGPAFSSLITALGVLAGSLTTATAVIPDINNAGAALTTALGLILLKETTKTVAE